MSLSKNVEGSVEVNQNTVYVLGLSKNHNSEMNEYINSEFSESDKGDDQLTKKAIFTIQPPLFLQSRT